MSERDIQKSILDWLNLVVGIKAYRRNTGATLSTYKGKNRLIRYNQAGMSDIWAIGPNGVHIEIEVKRPSKLLTEPQAEWLTDSRNAGAIAFFTSSLDDTAVCLRRAYLERSWPWNANWNVR